MVGVLGREIGNGKGQCSYQEPVAPEAGLGYWALVWRTAVDQAERSLGQIVAADHTVGARGGVDLGDTAAEVDAVAAAVLLNIAEFRYSRWEVDGCSDFVAPRGVAVQGRGHCADHNVLEGADRSR